MTRRLWVVLVALLLSVVTMPMASAARGGTDRPVRATLSGSVTWDIGVEGAECFVVTKTEATGTMSHLGLVSASWRHCPPLTEDPAYTNGHVVFTAANGDQVQGEYWDADGELPWTIDVVGGTGRFAEATGTLSLDRFDVVGEWDEVNDVPIEPWLWDATLSGTLSY